MASLSHKTELSEFSESGTALYVLILFGNTAHILHHVILKSTAASIGNESVPIQLAQCWFPGLAISSAKVHM